MNSIKPSQDIVPLSAFRAHVSELLKQTQQTGRPIVVTQHGRGAGVLVSAEEFGRMVEELDTLRGIVRGQSDALAGRTTPHDDVMNELDAIVEQAGGDRSAKGKRKKTSRRKVVA
jgi:prevent-host-death family protein